jgi:hypothetical protein
MAKNKKPEFEKLIRVEEAISTLRISPDQFRSWREAGRFKISLNQNGKQCISQNDLTRLAHSNDKAIASREAFMHYSRTRIQDNLTGLDAKFDEKIRQNVEQYSNYLRILENIHHGYRHRIDLTQDESALAAAYALHAKVLNLLNMACLTLEHHYWYSFILLRPIDEAIDLAHYFIIREDTEVGKKHLKVWFRENRSPSHRACREAISEFMATILGGKTLGLHEESMSDLYSSKSKSIHPNFNDILMGLLKPGFRNMKIQATDFDYGSCTNLRELYELSSFYQSSIWSTVQGFLNCFHDRMPLSGKDKVTLVQLDKELEDESDKYAEDSKNYNG